MTFVRNSEVSITDASEIKQRNAIQEEALTYKQNVHSTHIKTIGLRCYKRWNKAKYSLNKEKECNGWTFDENHTMLYRLEYLSAQKCNLNLCK